MPYRKDPLSNNETYHVFSRSIAGFRIFNSAQDFKRIVSSLYFYMYENPPIKFSQYFESLKHQSLNSHDTSFFVDRGPLVQLISYCIMPTHIHLLIKQKKENGISLYLYNLLKSHTLYFNSKYSRKGPLWEGRFKNVHVKTNEQFLHLTRYIHLNPSTSMLVENPKDWNYSSYKEYISTNSPNNSICQFQELIDLTPRQYETFVKNGKDYQRRLHLIKHLCID